MLDARDRSLAQIREAQRPATAQGAVARTLRERCSFLDRPVLALAHPEIDIKCDSAHQSSSIQPATADVSIIRPIRAAGAADFAAVLLS